MDNQAAPQTIQKDDPEYLAARRHVKALRGFYSHLASYLAVNGFFVLLNLLTSPNRWWAQGLAIGWGIGLLAHGLSVFVCRDLLGPHWEEKKVRELMAARRVN